MPFTLWISLCICPKQVILCIQSYEHYGAYYNSFLMVFNFTTYCSIKISIALRSYISIALSLFYYVTIS